MAARKTRKGGDTRLAPRGNAEGLAAIRMWTNALETAMIARYIGNAPTLRKLRPIVKSMLREIARIKPLMMSDCPYPCSHETDCTCSDLSI
jgi:hypothetical protein